jgi:cell fate regulator YaaT (PSP1 superfamily)
MSQTESTKPKGQKAKLMLVKYGRIGLMGWFEHHESTIPLTKKYVVIKTERGLELGEIVGVHNYRCGQFKSTPEQVDASYCNCGKDQPVGEGGSFVRFATHEDLHEQEHLERSAMSEAKCCQKLAEELKLNMTIIEAEHLFGGERIVFYFTSEGRVDFRELVKRLAKEYQTRIELRQIGSRDEAKLISDYETCGQQCCCSRYLKILEPVNMRMAKLQKATLDPSKISGHCGRLKCCLRYEDATYLELRKNLPQRNDFVQTPKGQGKVVDLQLLTQLVIVQDAMGDRQAWPVSEIRILTAEEAREMARPTEAPSPEAGNRRPRPPQKSWQRERPRPGGGNASGASRQPQGFAGFEDVDEQLARDAAETAAAENAQPQEQRQNNTENNNRPGEAQAGDQANPNGPKKNRNRRRRSKNRNRKPQNGQGGQNGQPNNGGQGSNNRPQGSSDNRGSSQGGGEQ